MMVSMLYMRKQHGEASPQYRHFQDNMSAATHDETLQRYARHVCHLRQLQTRDADRRKHAWLSQV